MSKYRVVFLILIGICAFCSSAFAEIQTLTSGDIKITIYVNYSRYLASDIYKTEPQDEITYEETNEQIYFAFKQQQTVYAGGGSGKVGYDRKVECRAPKVLFERMGLGVSLADFLKLKNFNIRCHTDYHGNAYALAVDYISESAYTDAPADKLELPTGSFRLQDVSIVSELLGDGRTRIGKAWGTSYDKYQSYILVEGAQGRGNDIQWGKCSFSRSSNNPMQSNTLLAPFLNNLIAKVASGEPILVRCNEGRRTDGRRERLWGSDKHNRTLKFETNNFSLD